MSRFFKGNKINVNLEFYNQQRYLLSLLTEAEDIKKRWQVYAEELYKKDIHDPDNHEGVIINLEPDILECKVKWALGSITMNKASGGDGIPNSKR